MATTDGFSTALENIRASHAAGRLAHAQVIVGPPGGAGLEFATAMIRLVLGRPEADVRSHPDVIWIEPEKKSRVIAIEQVRDANRLMAQKSFGGGWKAAVFLHADRLNEPAANALLKTLEEPAPHTLLLLVTDAPQALLPTIASRCQRIAVTSGSSIPDGPWRAPLMEILRAAPSGALERLAQGARIRALLEAERKRIASEEKAGGGDDESEDEDVTKDVLDARIEARVRKVRAEMLEVMMLWRRDILLVVLGADPSLLMFPAERMVLDRLAQGVTLTEALASWRGVQTSARRLDRNVTELMVFEAQALSSGGA
jgi:DNA polymerase III delta prime subunit